MNLLTIFPCLIYSVSLLISNLTVFDSYNNCTRKSNPDHIQVTLLYSMVTYVRLNELHEVTCTMRV